MIRKSGNRFSEKNMLKKDCKMAPEPGCGAIFICRFIVPTYLNFGGSRKSSGGSSVCGTSKLTLFGSTVEGLSSSAVTVIGNAITSTTMIACNPTQGRAPQ